MITDRTDALCKRSIALPNCFHGILFTHQALAYAEGINTIKAWTSLLSSRPSRWRKKKLLWIFLGTMIYRHPQYTFGSRTYLHSTLGSYWFFQYSSLFFHFTSRCPTFLFAVETYYETSFFVCSTWLKVIMLGGNH